MTKQTINVGSSANSGGGDPLRNALIKVNENFDEVYTKLEALEDGTIATSIVGDIKGSVFADDSTLLVDGVNGKIVGDIETDSLVVGNSGVINFNGSNVLNGGTVEAQTLIAGTIGASEVELLGGGIQSQTDISIDVNLTDSTTYRWKFTEGGDFQFPDNTIQTTAYRGIVSTHSGLDRIEVGGTPATMDNLSVRLVSSAPGANEVEINYDPDIVAAISVNRYGTNVLGGTEIVSNGNTTWWNIDDFTTGGDGTEFTVTDYDGKIYRVTVIMANITEVSPAPVTGDAYCVIERLK